MICLQKGKRYKLWTNDIIEVEDIYQDFLKDDTLAEIARCKLIEKNRSPFFTNELSIRHKGMTWPGMRVGDEMLYLVDSGFYCGWDHRSFPLHVNCEWREQEDE